MRWLLIIFFISCSTSQLVRNEEDAEVKAAYLDVLQQVYTLKNSDQIIKYDEHLKEVARYDNRIDGKITLIDVYNPQKIMLYLSAPQKIQFLDNQLAELNTLFLDRNLYPDVPIVAMSNNNQIWVWDDVEKQLIKVDEKGNELLKSYRMYDYNLSINSPSRIVEKNNKVYLEEEDTVYVFDNFGKYLSSYTVPSRFTIHYGDHGFRYINDDGELVSVTFPLMEESKVGIELKDKLNIVDVLLGTKHAIEVEKDTLYSISY